MDLLFLADEQEDMIDKYLDGGKMYVLEDDGVKCECVVTDEGEGVLELKNIATVPESHGKGYGRCLIEFICEQYKDRYEVIQVGTGDSPLTIPFYEKCGFRRHHIIKDFFVKNYDHPIFEEGVQLVDMIYLRKCLHSNLETERLILRRWNVNDAEDLYRFASDPAVGPIAGWPAHQSIDESRDVIKNVFNGKEAYAVCLKEDSKAIGAIELKLNGHTDMTDRDDECEMGYWLGRPFWGQGIIPEAVKEMLRHAFEDLAMQKVWIGYYDGNIKSKRVQEKCGFKYQWRSENVDVPLMHEKRTGHVSLMTKEDWETSHRTMKRELGIARCGLACCLCSENVTCKGCKRDGFMELSWCKDAEWCEVRRCGIEKNLSGCYECNPAECRKGLYAEKIKPRAFAEYARRYGLEELLDCLERNERAGVVYHREGITGDYDVFDDFEELIDFIKTGKKMCIDLKPIAREDIETVWKMQVEAFSDLLEKYQDYDMSPAAEDMDKVLARFEQPWTTYFFIMANNEKVGVVRVVDKKDGSRKRISPIWIMPEYRNKGYAQQAILAAEKKYGSNHWCLDTILQEKGNLHLYEKLGYHQTGRIDRVNDRMDIVYYEKD